MSLLFRPRIDDRRMLELVRNVWSSGFRVEGNLLGGVLFVLHGDSGMYRCFLFLDISVFVVRYHKGTIVAWIQTFWLE